MICVLSLFLISDHFCANYFLVLQMYEHFPLKIMFCLHLQKCFFCHNNESKCLYIPFSSALRYSYNMKPLSSLNRQLQHIMQFIMRHFKSLDEADYETIIERLCYVTFIFVLLKLSFLFTSPFSALDIYAYPNEKSTGVTDNISEGSVLF